MEIDTRARVCGCVCLYLCVCKRACKRACVRVTAVYSTLIERNLL